MLLAGTAGIGVTAIGGQDRLEPAPPADSGGPVAPSPAPTRAATPSGAPSPTPPGTAASPAARTRIVLREDGLELLAGGTSQVLLFRRDTAAQVRAALDDVLGTASEDPLPDCGADVRQRRYPALTVTLDGGVLTGWSTDDDPQGALRGVAGTRVGTTLRELRAARSALEVFDISSGREFVGAGGPSGQLDGPGEDARVSYLSAGNPCVFR